MNEIDEFPDDHDRTEYLISQYLDGSLGAPMRRELESRIEHDPRLAKLLGEYRAVKESVESWLDEAPSIDWNAFEANTTRRRRAIAPKRLRVALVLRVFAPLAAAAAILVFATSLFVQSDRFTTRIAVVAYQHPDEDVGQTGQTYVSYSRVDAIEEDDAHIAPTLDRPALAMAAIGTRVRWPATIDLAEVH